METFSAVRADVQSPAAVALAALTLDECLILRHAYEQQIAAIQTGDPEQGVIGLDDLKTRILCDMQEIGLERYEVEEGPRATLVRQTRTSLNKDRLVEKIGTRVLEECTDTTQVVFVKVVGPKGGKGCEVKP